MAEKLLKNAHGTLNFFEYDNSGLTKKDVLSVFPTFGDLRPKLDTFGAVYNILVSIWLQQSHPYNPPIVYVRPRATMKINSGRHVDMNGKIDLPCLRDWKYAESDLLGLIKILTFVFGEETTVYSTLKQVRTCGFGEIRCVELYEDGYRKNLLKLKGTIPVHFTGSDYNIPISIWLSKRHPFKLPIVYVTPSSRMHVMSGNFVDMNGKVNIPYLIDWNYPGSDLLSLIEIMTTVFSEELPVRGKSISKSDEISGAALQGRSNPGASSDNTASFDLSDEVHGRRTINRRHFELSDEAHGKRSSHDPN